MVIALIPSVKIKSADNAILGRYNGGSVHGGGGTRSLRFWTWIHKVLD